MEMLFGPRMQIFPKMISIKDTVANLPQIKAYEQSPHAILEMCPTSLLKQLKDKADSPK